MRLRPAGATRPERAGRAVGRPRRAAPLPGVRGGGYDAGVPMRRKLFTLCSAASHSTAVSMALAMLLYPGCSALVGTRHPPSPASHSRGAGPDAIRVTFRTIDDSAPAGTIDMSGWVVSETPE